MNVPDGLPMLKAGSHFSAKQGACVMEFVSVMAGETFTDEPKCVHPLVAGAARTVNDYIGDGVRNELAVMIPRFIGTSRISRSQLTWEEYDHFVRLCELIGEDSLPSAHRSFVHDASRCSVCLVEHRRKIAQLDELLDWCDSYLGREAYRAAEKDLREYEAARVRAALDPNGEVQA